MSVPNQDPKQRTSYNFRRQSWLYNSRFQDHNKFHPVIDRGQLYSAFKLRCNLVLFNCYEKTWTTLLELEPGDRRIDVWWFNDSSSRLMLLMAYLFTQTESWEDASIRLLASRHGQTKEKGKFVIIK